MRLRSGAMVLVATPLILVDLHHPCWPGFCLGSTLVAHGAWCSSPRLCRVVAAVSATLYLADLVSLSAHALRDGIHQLLTAKRLLHCSLFGLAVIRLAHSSGIVPHSLSTLAISGSIF